MIGRIATNIGALQAFDTLTAINKKVLYTQATIATGKMVNSAQDNPANYFISKKLARDINSLERKEKNIERGLNFLQTNDSKLGGAADILLEMSDLANQANSVVVTSAEKAAIQEDLYELREELEDILQSGVSSQLYTGFTLGGLSNVSLTGTGSHINPTLSELSLNGTNIAVTGAYNVETTINNIDNAYDTILGDQERLGSFIRRLSFEEDISSAEVTDTKSTLSSIEDADLAQQQLELSKLQILQQSSLLMLAQANADPEKVLSLFKSG